MKTLNVDAKTQKKLVELLATLSLQFVLGVLLTTVIDYNPDSSTLLQNVVLIAHAILGIYIVVIASIFTFWTKKTARFEKLSWWGLVAVLVAFSSGGYASQTTNAWAVLIMALGFLAAIGVYAKAYFNLAKKR